MFFFYPYYIKKEDAGELVKSQRIITALILIATAVTNLIITLFVGNRILNLYKESNLPVPVSVQISPFGTTGVLFLSIVIAVYYLKFKPGIERLNKVLAKYKDGELIKAKEVIDYRMSFLVLIFAMIIIAFTVYSNVLPIYNLTNSLE